MRRLIFIIFLCVFLFGISRKADANSINLLYANFSIQHTLNEVYNLYQYPSGTPSDTDCGGPYIGNFSNSTSTSISNDTGVPISARTSSANGAVMAESSIGLFSVQNYAKAVSGSIPIYLPEGIAYFGGAPTYNGTTAITNVIASWGFQPYGTSLSVELFFSQSLTPYGPYGATEGDCLSLKLWDTSNAAILLSLDSGEPTYYYSYSNDLTFLVDPTHIYQFDVSEKSYHVYDSNGLQQSVTAAFTSVPEPLTLLLLGAGFICLFGAGKRSRKLLRKYCHLRIRPAY